MVGILLGLRLARSGLEPAAVGAVIAAGLAGAAVASLVATLLADRLGRRAFLVSITALSVAGGAAVALVSGAAALGAAAFAGMLNGMGRDRGAALVVEQAMLASATSDERRTQAFAWYNVVQDAGHALGSLAAGLPSLLERATTIHAADSIRVAFALYA